jgi:hypothetical protein
MMDAPHAAPATRMDSIRCLVKNANQRPQAFKTPISPENAMSWFSRKDARPKWVQDDDNELIAAINGLKTLRVTPRGGMSIDPEEIRDQVIASRKVMSQFIDPGYRHDTARAFEHQTNGEVSQQAATDVIQIVTWRRVSEMSSIKYVCLQDLHAPRYAVATAGIFRNMTKVGTNPAVDRKVAESLTQNEVEWHCSIAAAMDAFEGPFQGDDLIPY